MKKRSDRPEIELSPEAVLGRIAASAGKRDSLPADFRRQARESRRKLRSLNPRAAGKFFAGTVGAGVTTGFSATSKTSGSVDEEVRLAT